MIRAPADRPQRRRTRRLHPTGTRRQEKELRFTRSLPVSLARSAGSQTPARPFRPASHTPAAQGTCTSLGFEAYLGGGCALLESNGWCLYQARVASNVSDAAACLMGTALADAVVAESATGSFSVAADAIEIDLELRFPENSELSTLGIEGSSCSADCSAHDCHTPHSATLTRAPVPEIA